MGAYSVFLLITFCGLVGIFLRRNLLNISVSCMQVIIGINGLAEITVNRLLNQELTFYFILLFSFTICMFIYSIATLLIRRRSTVQVNELTEMRG